MRARLIKLGCAVAIVAPSAALPAGAQASCVRARVGRTIECLAVGRPCLPRYEATYRGYGFTCRRDATGRRRLAQWIHQGQPKPGAA